jgi:citrate lyase subunit beta/citryl-CoA lyase
MQNVAPRSLLFTPATSPRRVEKAFACGADGVIVDLEDAVAVSEKPQARKQAAELLAHRREVAAYIRVNALSTPFCFEDFPVAVASAAVGIVLPKVESVDDVAIAGWMLTQLEAAHGKPAGSIELMPIVETARGMAAAHAIAAACKRLGRVRRLFYGAVDFALDLDVDLADEAGAMAQARFAIALACRAADLEGPMDTVFVTIADPEGLRASAQRARAMGFTGKACIHPAQIEVVNAAFTPTQSELARAQEIVTAFAAAEAAGAASVSVGGAMVDYPVVLKARRVLASARKLSTVGG